MEKRRAWHLFTILAVIALTVYNILPTVFYYMKPLKRPISELEGMDLAESISRRVDRLEEDAVEWLASFCNLIQVTPASVVVDPQNPQMIAVRFSKSDEAARFRSYLPRAGALIPFVPSQLSLVPQDVQDKTVVVQRRIPIRLNETPLFQYAAKGDELYQTTIIDRASQVAASLAGPTEMAQIVSAIETNESVSGEWVQAVASYINSLEDLPQNAAFQARVSAAFTQGFIANRKEALNALGRAIDQTRDELKKQKSNPAADLAWIEKTENQLAVAGRSLKEKSSSFAAGLDPWTAEQTVHLLKANSALDLSDRNPFFSELSIDWENERICLKLQADVAAWKKQTQPDDRLEQLLINEIAKVASSSNEFLSPIDGGYSIAFHQLPETQSLLLVKLDTLAEKMTRQMQKTLQANWHPKHPDLTQENFPVVDYAAYLNMPEEQQSLCLVLLAPLTLDGQKPQGVRNDSLYLMAKGLNQIVQSYEQFPHSEPAQQLRADLKSLHELLRQNGFIAYPRAVQIGDVSADLLFERNDLSSTLLAATREEFKVQGTKKFAVLELSNLEQRILTTNKIETRIHEDLLKWRDEYNSAQVSLEGIHRYDIPKPSKSIFWSNLALSLRKQMRGDERKIIRWGLDLSGGKTVQIELRDSSNRPVKEEEILKQGINELYTRVNKMGVSEISIRQVGNQIVLDFPGSQALSASELIRSSTMYFHMVNEKFGPNNSSLADSSNRFLQEVWNEAVVTNRKDSHSINAIAWKHLYGEDPSAVRPRSEAARTLLDQGLVLQSPDDPSMSNTLNDTTSKIALVRGENSSEWFGQTHPLLIVFRNYALEGSSLDHVRSAYDPSRGNYLSFDLKSSTLNADLQKVHPREDFYAWTSRFSKDKITGTPNETYSKGHGWRMAVVLNDTVISAPTLNEALRDSAMITGSFSQREVNQLAADLKAGSLTFTPHILSEKNVSPELGKTDRMKGIAATITALILVISSMVVYYRFAGLVASVAVFFNILIMWATLQNLNATLSLAGIAGLILTIGMAVDANVLVFERIKEEFAVSGKIASAISAGYRKAFSAIVDSNVTTIIAALILLNFDAGPIKQFAVTLIIGIASSMFTALFMTRFYFNGWLQNPKNKSLSMANWIRSTTFDFLRWSKVSFAAALAIIAIGCFFVVQQRATLFGMDFSGGFSLNIELETKENVSYAEKVDAALKKQGLTNQQFQIRELNPSNHLRILFSTSLEQPGQPFASMPVEKELANARYSFEKNPRIQWAVQTIESSGLSLTPGSKADLHTHWTAMSGQMSDSMRNNALIGLAIALAAIFIYIAFRFEYKFAAAAIICLFHDVLITMGLMGLLHKIGVPVQIDLNTVAALMTIIGYSLNDTIIIFDRIREDMVIRKHKDLNITVNHALNATLSRTAITSGTTLLVLLALVILGGSSIFSFALVMTIGVVFGTLSSWFIASPLMLYFQKREEQVPQQV